MRRSSRSWSASINAGLAGFDDHVIRMYARGMSVREIQGHLLELYRLQVLPDLISTVTDARES